MGFRAFLDGFERTEKVDIVTGGGGDEKFLDVVPRDAAIQLTRQTHEQVSDQMLELCDEFVRAYWAEKEAKKARDAAKEELLAMMERRDLVDWETDAGTFKVKVVKDSVGLVMKRVKEVLTEEQAEACTGVTRKGYTTIDFRPTKK